MCFLLFFLTNLSDCVVCVCACVYLNPMELRETMRNYSLFNFFVKKYADVKLIEK